MWGETEVSLAPPCLVHYPGILGAECVVIVKISDDYN